MARVSFIVLVGLGLTTGVVLGADPSLDLQIASFFRDLAAQPEIQRFDFLVAALRKAGPFAVAAAVAPAIVTLAMKAFWPQRAALMSTRAALFLILSLALGPGLIVNGVLKETWGRPRPGMVTEFGGQLTFRPWWDPRGGCESNCSFVSGETSSAVWMAAPAMLAPLPWRYAALGAAALYSVVFAFIRLLASGHFVSDVLFAAIFTGLSIWAVHGLIFRWPATRLDEGAPGGWPGRESMRRMFAAFRASRNAPSDGAIPPV